MGFYFEALKKARFTVVSSNLNFKKPPPKALKTYYIKSFPGLRVGFFGLITPDLAKVANVGQELNVRTDIVPLAREMVRKLRAQGADVVVLLSHLGHEQDRQLAREVEGIHVIIGGHDHIFFHEVVPHPSGWKTIIVQDGARGIRIGVLKLHLVRKRIVSHRWETILLDEKIPGDPHLHQKMLAYMKKFDQATNQVIGVSLVDLDARKKTIRSQETNLGDLVADAWNFKEGSLALVSSGSIRGDKIYPAGEITYKTALEILPFGNEIYEVILTGKQLKQVLEISASALIVPGDGCPPGQRASAGGFLQVSNLYVELDLSRRPFCARYLPNRRLEKLLYPGERVRRVWVKQENLRQPLDPEGKYHVLISSWMAHGGDGYYLFLDETLPKRNTTFTDVDLFLHYLQRHSPVAPRVEGRLQILSPLP